MGWQEIHQEIELNNEEKWLLNKLKTDYSDHTKAMFNQFALMYREVKLMGLDPHMLYRALTKSLED